jgi:hypothetical protein
MREDSFDFAPPKDKNDVLQVLDRVQTDILAVVDVLAGMGTAATSAEPGMRTEQVRAFMDDRREFVATQKAEIDSRMAGLRGAAVPDVSRYASALERISNRWDSIRFSSAWKQLAVEGPGSPAEQTPDGDSYRNLIELCRALAAEISRFSIPLRLPDRMSEAIGVGAPLDFHEEFKRELPTVDDRMDVLRRLAQLDPDQIGGLVDVDKGIIYRIGDKGKKWLSWVAIGTPVIVGIAALWAVRVPIPDVTKSTPLSAMAQQEFAALATNFVVFLAGVIVHIVKQGWEARRLDVVNVVREGGPLEIRSLFLWFHVRYGSYVITMVMAVAIFFVLAAANQTDILVYFLAGYTVDSVAESVVHRGKREVSAMLAQAPAIIAPTAPGRS